ncbi:ATP-grasp domain-containing protein [Aeromonas veronii]|uniref:ATP-grasp domain-containing protein n=1 Tax=Aeromonas veronii TaxID=654 RepID=UPI001117A390|nr:ATP-grasp domain-containing protein [Aeromonas veronii]
MKETVLIFSRNGYQSLLDSNRMLFSELEDKEIIYIFSVRTFSFPPQGTYKELHVVELIDNDSYIRQLLVALGSKYTINAVIAMDEQCIYPSALAREYFNLPGLRPDAAEMVRNKHKMKEWVSKSSVSCPEFISGNSISEIFKFYKEHGRVVCKPLDGMGSKETSIIESDEQLSNVISLLEKENRLHNFIFEEFIPAEIYHLDGVYYNSELVFSSLGSYDEPPVYFANSVGQTTNLTHHGIIYEKANQALHDIMQTFKLEFGVFHFEFFYYKNEVVFCEIGLRPAGGGIVEAIKFQCGTDLNREMVRLSLGLSPTTIAHGKAFAKVISFFAHNVGKVLSVSSSDEFDQDIYPYVKINRQCGDVNNPPRHNTDFVATFVMVDDNQESLENKAKALVNKFHCNIG